MYSPASGVVVIAKKTNNLPPLGLHCVLPLYTQTTSPGISNIRENEASLAEVLQVQMTTVLPYSFLFLKSHISADFIRLNCSSDQEDCKYYSDLGVMPIDSFSKPGFLCHSNIVDKGCLHPERTQGDGEWHFQTEEGMAPTTMCVWQEGYIIPQLFNSECDNSC